MIDKKQAKAFSPANISCLFKIYKHDNPRWAGSYGFGFTVNEGVTVTVSLSETSAIFFNNKRVIFPAVSYVVKKLTRKKVRVEIVSPLPVGAGFGLSGASALATAYAVNALLNLKKTKLQLAILAHTADVVAKTGLGGVVNQYFGGFLVKLQPSSHFKVIKMPYMNTPIYSQSFGKISTRLVLKDTTIHTGINKAATEVLKKIYERLEAKEPILFGEMISFAKEFAEESHLLLDHKTRVAIKYIEDHGGHASMHMLGNAVYSDIPFPGSMRLFISDTPARVIK